MTNFPLPPRELVTYSKDISHYFQKLAVYLENEFGISWSSLDFAGSDLGDILTRLHNDLQTIQGGASGDYYHLTQAIYDVVVALTTVSTSVDYTVIAGVGLVIVDSSGAAVEITLPASGGDGRKVSVKVLTGGNDVTVTPNGSDTIDGDAELVIEYVDSSAQLTAVSGGWLIV